MEKQYAERDIMHIDSQGNHYCRHIEAMTAEGLHDKSDIAAELAYRDWRIQWLEYQKKRLLEAVQATYRKHTLHDESIGWDELTDILANALPEAMGDDEFCAWLDSI